MLYDQGLASPPALGSILAERRTQLHSTSWLPVGPQASRRRWRHAAWESASTRTSELANTHLMAFSIQTLEPPGDLERRVLPAQPMKDARAEEERPSGISYDGKSFGPHAGPEMRSSFTQSSPDVGTKLKIYYMNSLMCRYYQHITTRLLQKTKMHYWHHSLCILECVKEY